MHVSDPIPSLSQGRGHHTAPHPGRALCGAVRHCCMFLIPSLRYHKVVRCHKVCGAAKQCHSGSNRSLCCYKVVRCAAALARAHLTCTWTGRQVTRWRFRMRSCCPFVSFGRLRRKAFEGLPAGVGTGVRPGGCKLCRPRLGPVPVQGTCHLYIYVGFWAIQMSLSSWLVEL